MTHISQKSTLQTVGLLCLDTCLNQLLFYILHISNIPRNAYNKRHTPYKRNMRLQSLNNARLTGSGHIGFLHLQPLPGTHQFQVILMKFLRIRPFRKYLEIGTSQCTRCRNFGMIGECLVPIQISEIIFRVFYKHIYRNIIQDGIQQIIQFAQFIPILNYIRNVLSEEPYNLFLPIFHYESGHLMHTFFYFPHPGIPGMISHAAPVITYFLHSFFKYLFCMKRNRQIIDFLYTQFAFHTIFFNELLIGIHQSTIGRSSQNAVTHLIKHALKHFQILLCNHPLADVTTHD